MRFNDLLSRIKELAKLVDDYMIQNLSGRIKTLYEASQHLIKAGGKRLRPFLVLTAYNVFHDDLNKAIPIAAAVEIFHTFTLIHDDIMDQDETRRGVPTVHVIWGVPFAILTGDLLHAKTFELLSKAKIDAEKKVQIIREMAESAAIICEGQAMDMLFEERIDVSIDEYLEMITKKTAYLFRSSARFGAIAADASEEMINSLTNYGENMGIAFQMVDDILGLFGEEKETGKPVGSDVRESKKTYPILYALANAPPEKRERLKEILLKKEKTEDEISEAISIIRDSGGEKVTRELAREYAKKAIDAISILPESDAKRYLIQLAEFTIQRSY